MGGQDVRSGDIPFWLATCGIGWHHRAVPAQESPQPAGLPCGFALETQPGYLAALFWPDYPQAEARANLCRTLTSFHEVLGESGLEADRETLCLPASVALRLDVAEFQQHLSVWHSHCCDRLLCSACITSLEQATALHSDDFMSGFNLSDSPAFDDWAFFQREELCASLSAALAALAQGLLARGDHDPAIGYVRRRVSLDPLDEAAHSELMRVYAAAGQRPAALRQFAECERVLKEELGITPGGDRETSRGHPCQTLPAGKEKGNRYWPRG